MNLIFIFRGKAKAYFTAWLYILIPLRIFYHYDRILIIYLFSIPQVLNLILAVIQKRPVLYRFVAGIAKNNSSIISTLPFSIKAKLYFKDISVKYFLIDLL